MQEWRLTRLNGEFCVAWDEPQPNGAAPARRRYRLGTSDAREAETLAPARYSKLSRPSGTTVAHLWKGYVLDNAGKAVIETMVHTWKAIGPYFGQKEGAELTLEECRAYTDRRRSTAYFTSKTGVQKFVQDGTVHTELGHLRTVLVWAKDNKLIAEAPRIERPSKPEPKDFHLTRVEVRKLLDAAKSPHIVLAIRLLIATGARVTAALELTWDRVDFEREMIQLRNPFDRARRKGRATVPMNQSLRVELEKAGKRKITNYVIEYACTNVKSIKKGLGSASRAAGLTGVSPHVLRHSAAVWLAEDGHDMEEIAQFLGHDDVNVTRKIYARFSPTYLRKLANSLDI
ncbi:site-specific integrase [Rhizobium sp. TH2]|uniref:tyrosine-type recombinase/integrase n=1 Tax=Rhizobium sp. TH2 TaxID=2775403 RepID=UPI0021575676|nr:site-specific integrase [Rhizobium sp. TH2]UVC07699.1 site-specific integrase [Rhizobium sp. TH2]